MIPNKCVKSNEYREKKEVVWQVRERHFFKSVSIQVTAVHIIALDLPQMDFYFYKMSDEVAKLQKQTFRKSIIPCTWYRAEGVVWINYFFLSQGFQNYIQSD